MSFDIGHEHRDVNGGWLRPTVFGGMDGLLSNSSLLAGILGAQRAAQTAQDAGAHNALLMAGIAGLLAGAFSMAVGEWISVATQTESMMAEIETERLELEKNPEGELRELAHIWEARGLSPDLAHQVAVALSTDAETTLVNHVKEELGLHPEDLPNPWVAGISSLLSFAVGAAIPLIPFLLRQDEHSTTLALQQLIGLTAITLFVAGATVSRFTNRSWLYNGMRQLLVGGLAGTLTYLIGSLVGGSI